jgi:RsiW-degrading membrane proteinase PrsW (M82 family)
MSAGVVISFLATALPTALWTRLIWWCDRYEREPIPLVTAAFLWGAIPAVILSLIAEELLGVPFAGIGGPLVSEVISSSAIAPLVEELAKGTALFLILRLWPAEFDDVLDGILYGALIGFGFAMTENLFYFLSALDEGGWVQWGVVVFMRSVLFGLNHAFFTAFTGAGLGYAATTCGLRRRLALLAGLIAAILVHALHNLGASLAASEAATLLLSLVSDTGGVLIVILMIVLALQQERKWIRAELQAEVGRLLTAQEYEALLSTGGRARQLARARKAGGWRAVWTVRRRQEMATELAFRKHRARVRGTDAGLNRQIVQHTFLK